MATTFSRLIVELIGLLVSWLNCAPYQMDAKGNSLHT